MLCRKLLRVLGLSLALIIQTPGWGQAIPIVNPGFEADVIPPGPLSC